MDINYEIKKLKNKQNEIDGQIKSLEDRYIENTLFTNEFLECCRKNGIKKVGINTGDESLEGYRKHPFGKSGNVFADEDKDGWPAIWAVCEQMNISGGCGNGGQHQISSIASAKLIDGIYELENGIWKRIDGDE